MKKVFKFKKENGVQTTVVGANSTICGDIICSGHICVSGTIGVELADSPDYNFDAETVILEPVSLRATHSIRVEASARVAANITCSELSVDGRIDGNIDADKVVILGAKSIVHGNIVASGLIIEEGAEFCGNVKIRKA